MLKRLRIIPDMQIFTKLKFKTFAHIGDSPSYFGGFGKTLFPYGYIKFGEDGTHLKKKIDVILPIVLSLLLPGLSFLTRQQNEALENAEFYPIWGLSSVILYNTWYLIWNLWDIRRNYQNFSYLLKLLLFIAGSIGVTQLVIHTNFQYFNSYSFARTSFGVFLFTAIQHALRTQENLSSLRLEKEQIQSESYKAQLQALHAKIDPHFLFNSLNTLRSLVRRTHANSEQFILSLSDFYRQTLKYNEEVKLPLSEELVVLESYLFLMKNRNEEAVFVEINIDKSLHSRLLPTLALQIVVENCFKHNSMTTKNPLRITIRHTEDGYIEVKNNLQPKLGEVESTGNGLELLVKRYELMHISDGVKVEKTPDEFYVKLKLID